MVVDSLPLVPYSGTYFTILSAGSTFPSWISSQSADEVIALVADIATKTVSSVAGFSTPPCTARPKVFIAASFPLRAIATWHAGRTPSFTSRSARSINACTLSGLRPTSAELSARNFSAIIIFSPRRISSGATRTLHILRHHFLGDRREHEGAHVFH